MTGNHYQIIIYLQRPVAGLQLKNICKKQIYSNYNHVIYANFKCIQTSCCCLFILDVVFYSYTCRLLLVLRACVCKRTWRFFEPDRIGHVPNVP